MGKGSGPRIEMGGIWQIKCRIVRLGDSLSCAPNRFHGDFPVILPLNVVSLMVYKLAVGLSI